MRPDARPEEFSVLVKRTTGGVTFFGERISRSNRDFLAKGSGGFFE
jgi:hypothetical protein